MLWNWCIFASLFLCIHLWVISSTTSYSIVDPWITWRLGVLIPCACENLHVTVQLALRICSSPSADSTNHGSYSTVVHIYWKNAMYKCTHTIQTSVFKDQLYLYLPNTQLWVINSCDYIRKVTSAVSIRNNLLLRKSTELPYNQNGKCSSYVIMICLS